MRKLLLTVLSLAMIAPAFAGPVKHKKKKKKAKKGIVSVSMHRTTCFGRCPDYTVEINRNGMVTYTGVRFTPDTGMYEKNIGEKAAMEIINSLAEYRIDTCRNLYENRIPDIPGIIYMVKYSDSTKRISNANFGPSFLTTTAEQIDKLGRKTEGNETGWKKIMPVKGK